MADTASRERANLPPVTTADYLRAESYLSWNVKPLVFNERVTPHWLGEGNRFWYRRTSRQGSEFILVDPAAGTREPAFDHDRLAAELSKAVGKPFTGNQLPFTEISFNEPGGAITFAVGDTRWSCDLDGYTCSRLESKPDTPKPDEVRSPDGRWDLFSRGGNLFVREVATDREHQLTDDAEEYYDYGSQPDGRQSAVTDRAVGRKLTPSVRWSADSTRVLTYRLDQRRIKPLHLLQAFPEPGSWRPRLHSYHYALPGDEEVGEAAPLIIDVPSGEQQWLEVEPLTGVLHSPLDLNLVWWSDDGERVSIVNGSRDRQRVKLVSVDVETGKARTILEESSRSWVYPQHVPMETPITCVREVEVDGRQMFIWLSGRSGWMHLYLVSGDRDPSGGNDDWQPITGDAWSVRDVVRVDQAEQRVYFTACGREAGEDPYYRHLYRCKLDGSQLELLTPEDAEHDVSAEGQHRRGQPSTASFSPDGTYFVDVYSRIDQPPVSVLRSSAGRLVMTLEEADISGLLARGWRLPERFQVKARDGITDIYGSIIRPSNYDPSRRYPVLDAIYPGPQIIRTPKAFPAVAGGFWQDQALAELGFVVITIDGLGTPFRSRAFHDVAYGVDFGEAGGLTDHVIGIKQLGARDPSLDLERVGIYGHSGGGYASARAMLLFPELYKVAVSSAGNHDNRGYVALWGEGWMGPFDEETYESQDNVHLAENLQGKLLLVHGELDDNVHLTLTLRMADALIAANKDFDLLIIPNTNHGLFDTRRGLKAMQTARAWGNPYFTRKRWDYFVRHLRGSVPPAGYQIRQPSVE